MAKLDNNDIKIKPTCNRCGKKLSMGDIIYHDIGVMLCYECFLKYILYKED